MKTKHWFETGVFNLIGALGLICADRTILHNDTIDIFIGIYS